jgi:DNA-directed RNA polymerase specialized sigma24 family protein
LRLILDYPAFRRYNNSQTKGSEAADTETDEELFRRFQNGGRDAELSQLVERHGDSVTLYINAIIGDAQDAEDLMIEAFSRICAKEPSVYTDGGFRPYLYKTARNLALRFASREQTAAAFRLRRHESGAGERRTCWNGWCRPAERDALLRLCLDKLHPDYREALYLTYFEDLSQAEAAAVMAKNEKQIKNLVFRGKQALRALLEKEGITDAHDF